VIVRSPALALAAALLTASAPAAAARAKAAPAASAPATSPAVADLGRGYAAYRSGDYAAAAKILRGVLGKGLRNEDWALYLLGESEFYDGATRAARERFERLARGHGGLPAEIAPFRIADCLWMEGERDKAAAAYARLTKKVTPTSGDAALIRFRLAEVAAARDATAGRAQFLAIARDFPAHPLADEALRRIAVTGTLGGFPNPPATDSARQAELRPRVAAPADAPPVADLPPADRLRRAESLTKSRHWDEALAELARLPATLPPAEAAERDYQIGMTKFHMRRDYAKAGEMLLAAVPHLTGDKAASAQFHGARALSRVDRDDEAIAGYRKVVAQFPHSPYAAEAQFRSGFLDYNRGRFRESLPALQATLDHFGKSAFADDAAWCLAFAHFLLGDAAEAAAGFERYGRLPSTGIASDEVGARVAYWRARLRAKLGHKDEAEAAYRELARRAPLSFYGLLARARLKEAGHEEPVHLPDKPVNLAAPANVARDPAVARADELIAAGMTAEAALELERAEKDTIKRLGGDKALPYVLGLYARAGDYRRAYRLAEGHAGGALGADPRGSDGVRAFWEAAFPKAYAPLVDKYGPPAGSPDLYLYTIMRKESGFDPHDVSYADARGLLQMIPPTSAKVAAASGDPFFPDQLYDPEVNIRLGALYIGSLYKKFGREVPLAAGAYNAGPRAMGRWCTQLAGHPTDEFIELITFEQTREYVKRVVSLYAKYRYLYGPTGYELPLTLDTKVDSGGPDY
jgi:soluble lytic murein transglycosylase